MIMIERLRLNVIFGKDLKTFISLKALGVFSFIVISNLIPFSTSAQSEKYKLEDLINKTWSMQGLNDLKYEENYEIDHISIFLDNNLIGKMEYYLSDSIVTVFDSINVGRVNEGRYIVRRILQNNKLPKQLLKVSVFEIKKLDPDTLILRNIKHQHLLIYIPR